MTRKIRYGMVGGGEGAFIGAVHRAAAAIDGEIELVCGAFSSNAGRSRKSGERLHLPPERCYTDFKAMMHAEAALPPEARMDFVSIVTPNHLHLPVAEAALNQKFHVLCDKPATISLAQCFELRGAIAASGCLYGLTHPYVAYPMVIEAAQRVRAGQLGTIRKVIVEYTQGWLAGPVEHEGNAQAMWRLDPKRAGPSCTMGDIGVHAFNLTEFVSGLQVTELGAELNRVVAGRKLDDDGIALLRFAGGATGVLIASQICTGDENDLRLRVYGDAASLEWKQQDPNSLWIKHAAAPIELVRSASMGLGATAHAASRLPSGHPEGYIEAFANVYRSFAAHLRARDSDAASAELPFVPGIEAALRGMAFIETVVAASRSRAKWHAFPEVG